MRHQTYRSAIKAQTQLSPDYESAILCSVQREQEWLSRKYYQNLYSIFCRVCGLLLYKSVLAMKTEQDFAIAIFAERYAKDASATQIADAATSTWRDIYTALSPIIGQRGVVILTKRCLHLQQRNYPSLKAIRDSKILPGEFPALHAVLVKETSANAVLINNALLNTFYELLSNLIGTSLTLQLLHSVFELPSNGDPVQDTLS